MLTALAFSLYAFGAVCTASTVYLVIEMTFRVIDAIRYH